MAKRKAPSGADKRRRSSSNEPGRAEASAPATSSMFLDQDEVMKAMRAQMAASAGKGKGREQSGSEDEDLSEDEIEDESEEEEAAAGSKEEERAGAVGGAAAESEAESSTQALSPKAAPVAALPSRVTASTKPAVVKPAKKGLLSAPKPSSETTFESLGLSAPIISALKSISIRKPTEIQSACVGPIMAGESSSAS